MTIKRHLLYGTYRLLKKIGYFEGLNQFFRIGKILLFHRVAPYGDGSLTTSTLIFEGLMREISSNFKPVPLQDVIERIKNRKPIDPKTVVITFDDNYRDTFLHAVPILLKYDIPATFFITSGFINSDRHYPWDAEKRFKYPMMRWEDVKEIVTLGFEVGCHTVNHVNLGNVHLQVARDEIFDSKDQIENRIGRVVQSFAFPFGRKDCIIDEVRQFVKEAGFECCCSAYGGKVTENSNLYDLHRIPEYQTLIEFLMELDHFNTHFDGRMSINLFGDKGKFLIGN